MNVLWSTDEVKVAYKNYSLITNILETCLYKYFSRMSHIVGIQNRNHVS